MTAPSAQEGITYAAGHYHRAKAEFDILDRLSRRRHAECKLAFDAIREHWRADMRRTAVRAFPARRDERGRFAL